MRKPGKNRLNKNCRGPFFLNHHSDGGGGGSFFGLTERPGGGGAFDTNVAHVFPDSGLYSTVRPGIGGMRIK